MATNKIIVTNLSALKSKYGSGYVRVHAAIGRLIAADRQRGLATKVVAIDSPADLRAAGGKPVSDAQDEPAAKAAVDAVCAAHQPDYLMILGAPDVIPLQRLRNPMRGDGDRDVPSDLPYACSASYSTDPSRFLGPTRVMGRLPDLLAGHDPAYLVRLLGTAARYRSRPRQDYQRHFGLSAQIWQASTGLSLTKLFGSSAQMQTSPPRGPGWSDAQLASRMHFINCHGGASAPEFYGQPPKREQYPVAHQARRLKSKVSNGAVIAAECCYGAELYDPEDAGGQMGICSMYLADGAYGFFGSTTVAYGPSEGNGQADLICQFFIESVLGGASLGRATLEARQRFAALYTHLDPMDLKTIEQFYLLGDPSVHPVGAATHALARTKVFKQAFRGQKSTPGARALRRERLARTGTNLQQTLGAVRPASLSAPNAARRVLEEAARESGLKEFAPQSYVVAFPRDASSGEMRQFASARRSRSVHLVLGEKSARDQVRRVVAIAATVQEGEVVHIRRVHSR